MKIQLRELSTNDKEDIFQMIREIGPGENGYINSEYEMDYRDFPSYLKGRIKISRGIDLGPQYVPQTMYWLLIDERPVGIGKLRHYLNDDLRRVGGHIGYTIRPSERGKGYGTILLRELIKEAKAKGIDELLLTCEERNIPSKRVIEGNNGELFDILDGKCRYWIKNY